MKNNVVRFGLFSLFHLHVYCVRTSHASGVKSYLLQTSSSDLFLPLVATRTQSILVSCANRGEQRKESQFNMTHRRRQRTHARSGDGTHLRTHAYDKTARPRFHAVPPIIPSGSMAVTRNAVRRGGPTAQISGAEPLICQPTAILSAAPQARGGRPVWRNQSPVTGDTKLACGAPK